MSTTNKSDVGKKYLKPAPGLLVRKPNGALLKEDGEWIVLTHYWYRRLRVNDVIETSPPLAPEKAANVKSVKKGKSS